MASSSSRPKPLDLSRRGIHIEPVFDPHSFKDERFCDVAIRTINNSPLAAFARLPDDCYPRVVRKFYEALKTNTDVNSGLATCEVTIDEVVYRFTSKDIAMALGIKGYKPIPYDEHEVTMREALIFRPPPVNPGNVVRESYLHEDFWVIDKFMKAYACPYIHDNIIPQYLYKYWHGMYTRSVIDVPALMLECMLNARDGGRTNISPHMLVLPRSITAILKRLKYKFSATELKEGPDDVFNYKRIKKSIDALAVGASLKEPTTNRRRSAQERREEREQAELDEAVREQERLVREQEELRGRWSQGYMHGGVGNPPETETRGAWDAYMPNQEPQQRTWGEYPRQQEEQPPQPSQEEWQNQMMGMMRGYGTTLEGLQGQMQGMNLTMHEGFQRFDIRFDALEAQVGALQGHMPPPEPFTRTYQRQRRRRTVVDEDEEEE